MTAPVTNHVTIRPGVGMLSVLRHLNYRPWFALAEFVDNAVQSYRDHRDTLLNVDGTGYRLVVNIDIFAGDGGSITIRDNAAGIDETNYPRAFRPAAVPVDRRGLSEFGMGMKSAACWFAAQWQVRTAALGEGIERVVQFDIARIVRDDLEELDVTASRVPPKQHYTEIVLRQLHRTPYGRTLGKIREHLADIYRVLLRAGELEIHLNSEPLRFEEPAVLCAAWHRDPTAPPVAWRKDIDFDFGGGLSVSGFAAIRETANTARAGFALFRRGRLIQGSGDEGYRPSQVFGRPNSFVYQRLFGELHLEGFEVSHTKDGFQWDDNEEPFLELLRKHLDADPLPLVQQAREYRVNTRPSDLHAAAEDATKSTAESIQKNVPPVASALANATPPGDPPQILPATIPLSARVIDVELRGEPWRITIELTGDPAVGDWLELGDAPAANRARPREVALRMAVAHPFTQRFCSADGAELDLLLRLAAAIGLAEVIARDSGVKFAGTIRRNINELLRNALCKV